MSSFDPPDRRSSAHAPSTERLAFSFPAAVPVRRPPEPTFATAAYSEPRDWGYTGLFAFTAVLLIRPQEDIPGLASLRLAEICAIIGIAPMLLHRFTRRLPVFRVTAETMGLVLFGAAMLATVPFSIWPGGALSQFLDTFLKVLVVFVLMMNTVTTAKRLEQLTWLILLAVGYIALRGVIDYARGANLVEDGRLAGPVGGIFGNPNDLAMNMVSILPIATIAAMSRRYTMPWRLAAAACAILMMATVVFTKSRGGALGLVIALLALMVLSRRVRPMIIGGALVGSLVIVPFLPASFTERMASIVNPEQDEMQFTGSREARTRLLQDATNAFLAHPLTGVGAGQFRNYDPEGRLEPWREAHNVILQVAADLGIVGVLALGFLIVSGIRTALVLRRRLAPGRRRRVPVEAQVLSPDEREMLHGHAVAMSAALIGWFACALFASVAYSWTFYYLLALTVAARELIHDRVIARAEAQPEPPDRRGRGFRHQQEPLTA